MPDSYAVRVFVMALSMAIPEDDAFRIHSPSTFSVCFLPGWVHTSNFFEVTGGVEQLIQP